MKAIFTNDDVGASSNPKSVEGFQTVVDWLNSREIKATFFWVPKPGDFKKCHELWNPTVLKAREQGHDFQLHGLSHGSCLEFGVPQESTRRTNSKVFHEYELNRAKWEAEHSVQRLKLKLEEGVAIYQQVFAERPKVFRAPCFGVCPAMYEALAGVGIRYSSSRGLNPTATAYTILGDKSLRRWSPDFPCRPWVEPPGVTEIVCMEDLCIGGVAPDQFDDRLDLVISELNHFIEEAGHEGVLVIGSHYHSMMKTWDQTRPLLEKTLDWLAQRGITEWGTFREFVDATGAQP
jgi:peptidoglycan/xylan/chitin deacetylase (PgdA/CDA1 family)